MEEEEEEGGFCETPEAEGCEGGEVRVGGGEGPGGGGETCWAEPLEGEDHGADEDVEGPGVVEHFRRCSDDRFSNVRECVVSEVMVAAEGLVNLGTEPGGR